MPIWNICCRKSGGWQSNTCISISHARDTEDLVDPPGGLARMAKEMIQASVRQQSDVSVGMANRLNKGESDRLWIEQAQWRATNPKYWWQGVLTAWVH